MRVLDMRDRRRLTLLVMAGATAVLVVGAIGLAVLKVQAPRQAGVRVQGRGSSTTACKEVLQGELPMLTALPNPRAQDSINADIESSLCTWAQQEMRLGQPEISGLTGFGVGYRVHYLDEHLVSIQVQTATISSKQAHPSQHALTLNYLLADGARIERSKIFYPYDITLNNLLTAASSPPRYAEWAEWADSEQSEPFEVDTFVIDNHGIVFVFDPCALVACVAGYISLPVPYASLTGLIDPQGAAAPYL